MAQSAEILQYNTCHLLEIFRAKADAMSGAAANNYKKAIACLRSFVMDQPQSSDIATTTFLENWFIFMFFRGLSAKTSLHYFDIIAGLYNSVETEDNDNAAVFREAKARIKQLASDKWLSLIEEDCFKRLVNITRTADRQSGETALYTDILLFSLLNHGMKITDIANIKCDELHSYTPESRMIVQRHISPKRKYVFPLDQTKLTPRQLERSLNSKMLELFESRNIKHIGNIQESINSYWAYAALRCGYLAGNVIGMLDRRPIGLPILSFCSEKSILTPEQRQSLTTAVADIFVANPQKWYAMRLRPGVKFESLTERLNNCSQKVSTPEFFYPCQEIAKRINRKLIFKEKPILPDIVFFRSRVTDIQPLFHQIGDLAWCYTSGDTYASIPQESMIAFQKAIGKFTPDYEVGPVGSIQLRPGDRIVVVGGSFSGKEGEILEKSLNESGTIYRITLWGDQNNIEWRVNDSRLIEKIQ